MKRQRVFAVVCGSVAALFASSAIAVPSGKYRVTVVVRQGDEIVAKPSLLVDEGKEATFQTNAFEVRTRVSPGGKSARNLLLASQVTESADPANRRSQTSTVSLRQGEGWTYEFPARRTTEKPVRFEISATDVTN